MVAKPISIKDAKRKFGGCAWKAIELISGLWEGRAGDCSPYPDSFFLCVLWVSAFGFLVRPQQFIESRFCIFFYKNMS